MIYPWVQSRHELSSLDQERWFRDAGPGAFGSAPRNQGVKSCKDWVGGRDFFLAAAETSEYIDELRSIL